MNLRNLKKYLPAVVFCAFIGVMCLLFLFSPDRAYSSNEKRYLTTFPKLTTDTFFSGQFGKEYETYISDQTAGRDFFVGLNAYYDLASGRNGSNGVYSGKDGYLINKPADRENYLEANLKTFSKFVKETGIDTTLLIAPSTGYIMEDKLPSGSLPYLDDEYFELIEKNKGDMDFVNIKGLFKEKAADKQLYYRTDHHWTTRGAYTAYQAFCAAKGLDAAQENRFDVKSYPGFYGTTYSTSALWLTPPEEIELWHDKAYEGQDNIHVTIEEGGKKKESSSFFFLSHLEEDDKYPVFLDGNHSLVRIENKAASGGKLLLLKDSFGHSIAPFLSENYSEIIMVDLRYYKLPVSELIEKEGISEMLVLYGLDNLCNDTDVAWLK